MSLCWERKTLTGQQGEKRKAANQQQRIASAKHEVDRCRQKKNRKEEEKTAARPTCCGNSFRLVAAGACITNILLLAEDNCRAVQLITVAAAIFLPLHTVVIIETFSSFPTKGMSYEVTTPFVSSNSLTFSRVF